MSKQALGRGLGALIPVRNNPPASPAPALLAEAAPGEKVHSLEIARIISSRYQPRTIFNESEIGELAESIRTHGLLQPLIVVRRGDSFELVAGERRLRAAKSLGHTTIACLLREASDAQLAELALIENLQRENLTPLEEAQAYQKLLETFNLSQEELAGRVGKSRTAIANALRLLDLCPEIKSLLAKNTLSVGHAKVLMGLSSQPKLQIKAAQEVVRKDLSVRQTELLVAKIKSGAHTGSPPKNSPPSGGDARTTALIEQIQKSLQQKLGTRVHIRHGQKKGAIIIEYFGNDDLGRLLERFGINL